MRRRELLYSGLCTSLLGLSAGCLRLTEGETGTATESRPTETTGGRPSITGRLTLPVTDDLSGNTLSIMSESEQFFNTRVEADGSFEKRVRPGRSYYVTFYNGTDTAPVTEPNGLPIVYWVDRVTVGETGLALGERKLPEAHRLSVTVTDSDGEPVPEAEVMIRSNGFGFPSGTFVTNDAGELSITGASEPGVEVAGPITVTLLSHSPADGPSERSLNIQEPTELEYEVRA